jgi:hypothetical protein
MTTAPRDGTAVLLRVEDAGRETKVTGEFRRTAGYPTAGKWVIPTTGASIGAVLDDETGEWNDSVEQRVLDWEPLP